MNDKPTTLEMAPTDTRFFTNQGDDVFLNRLGQALKSSELLDILVGYFFASGFLDLSKHIMPDHKLRVLVGLNSDKYVYSWLDNARKKTPDEHRKDFCDSFIDDLQRGAEDNHKTLQGARQFMKLVKEGRLEVRIHPERNIHAKLYIATFKDDQLDKGRVFTGSSNLTHSGLSKNHEINVELKDIGDYHFAKGRFEELWEQGIEISADGIEATYKQTWVNPDFTAYEVYLKFLYEYFKDYFKQREELNLEEGNKLPDNYTRLSYQMQAVSQAKQILEEHGGVFLSDVVGLGKTYITALLLKRLAGQSLIVCSPALKNYWEDTLRKFNVPGYKVESWGLLEKLVEEASEYDNIIVDEAHTFRNEKSERYKFLHKLCYLKRVILVTATPYNNKMEDILAQIHLFQATRDSTIRGQRNLHDFFTWHSREIAKAESESQKLNRSRRAANETREKILNHIMVRRTRSDVRRHFEEDMEKQGLFFPKINTPITIPYRYDDFAKDAFEKTIKTIHELEYVRYKAPLYLKDPPSAFNRQRYLNLSGFMKSVLVKRMDSSFTAFKHTLRRFIESHDRFIKMFNGGDVFISKRVDVYDYLDADNLGGLLGELDSELNTGKDKLFELVEEGKVEHYPSGNFDDDFREKLENDLKILRETLKFWNAVETDPKLDNFLDTMRANAVLREGKIILFSEAKETIEYLHTELHKVYPNEVMAYFSGGGYLNGEKTVSKNNLQEALRSNFDPNSKTHRDDIRILLATDILSEGVNLHRANIIINYDLPWNPTRVLQRSGRVNRVGTEHEKIHIFNFFPSAGGDKVLGLSANIKAKIEAFHTALGEDARYLTGDEDPQSYEIFAKNMMSVMDAAAYEGSMEGDEFDTNSELDYFNVIKKIREKDPQLFDRIKSLPDRLRVYRTYDDSISGESLYPPYLLSFFKCGLVKKFISVLHNEEGELHHRELLFSEAARILRADPKERGLPETSAVEEFLDAGKERFGDLLSEPGDIQLPPRSNEARLQGYIKILAQASSLMEQDDNREFVNAALGLVRRGLLPDMVYADINKELGKHADELEILQAIRKHVKFYVKKDKKGGKKSDEPAEVILSNFFVENE